tara:strand:+ start:19 stop:2106 length:2088 start_codon:yes stop_codon:yes gene_type:complete
MDKTSYILNYGQRPLINSYYSKYINNNENPYGVNTIVAIMSLNGYNVEDAILINEGSLKRGLFRTTYYSTYSFNEKSSDVEENDTEKIIENVSNNLKVKTNDTKNYKYLDSSGLIKENILVDDKTVIIGGLSYNKETPELLKDISICPKKGQKGYVDKSFITIAEKGFRVSKVKIREERIPALGDKMASRAGQKGTLGLIIPEEDMPYTENGLKPDLIINPHAIPSRMTIGQLIEVLLGKACIEQGLYGDCTAFENTNTETESKIDIYGKLLQEFNYESTGYELMYDGISGEQLESKIFIGPTYYMRLKHMVKDKINYRSDGPRNTLTRQTVQGRANDGGLRIGEMERDGIMAHGMSLFLKDSFMIRGDKYFLAVCNNSGGIAIYNSRENQFYSPLIDGKVDFDEPINEKSKISVVSKYGLDFSIIKIPYCMKLLIHELQTMNISIKLITEDNINNLVNMNVFDQEINIPRKKSIEVPENSIMKSVINEDFDLSENVKNKDENIEFDNDNDNDNDNDILIDQLELPEIDESIYTITYEEPTQLNEELLKLSETSSDVLPAFYPDTVVDDNFGAPMKPILYKATSPEFPPPLENSEFQPTTPDWDPPATPEFQVKSPDYPPPATPEFQPTTPDWSPPNSNDVNTEDFQIETVTIDKFKNIKDSISMAKNKSIIKQDDTEEKDEEKDDDDTKGIKMI